MKSEDHTALEMLASEMSFNEAWQYLRSQIGMSLRESVQRTANITRKYPDSQLALDTKRFESTDSFGGIFKKN